MVGKVDVAVVNREELEERIGRGERKEELWQKGEG